MPEVYVALGSNVRRRAALRFAFVALTRRFGPLQLSFLYESPDTTYGGAAYWNLVIGLRSRATPAAMRAWLHTVERRAGRDRRDRAICALDLDLLSWGLRARAGPPRLSFPHLRRLGHWPAVGLEPRGIVATSPRCARRPPR